MVITHHQLGPQGALAVQAANKILVMIHLQAFGLHQESELNSGLGASLDLLYLADYSPCRSVLLLGKERSLPGSAPPFETETNGP